MKTGADLRLDSVRLRAPIAVLLLCMLACNRGADSIESRHAPAAADGDGPKSCPARAKANTLPNAKPELERADYWRALAREAKKGESVGADDVLLDAEQLAVQGVALRSASDGVPRIVDLSREPSSEELRAALAERLSNYGELFSSGKYESARASAQRELSGGGAGFTEARELRVALAPIDLRCVPFPEPIKAKSGSEGFDRNRCSQARAQEPIELLGRIGDGMRLARTQNAFGFVPDDAPLSPVVPRELEDDYREGADLALARDLELAGQKLPRGTLLRAAAADVAWLASADQFVRSRALASTEVTRTARPLTRAAFLQEAFAYLGSPYGWGDEAGGRDCSRFVLDVLATFGLALPRTSSHQSHSGRYTVEVPEATSETERLALLDAAHARGLALVHFPGHIMFYLGRDRDGVPRAIHSFAEYVAPCPGGGETLMEVGRVAVSDLSLGKGSSRKSFLERISHVSVFGRDPGYELLALSKFRAPVPPAELAPKACNDSTDRALFRSPREPDEGRPLRIVSVSADDVRPASLFLVSPEGAVITPEVHDLGVGPYARWAEVQKPKAGKWRALLADGERVLACEEFRVASKPKKTKPAASRGDKAPAWSASMRWERDTEALYAAFVEQLFSHPIEDLRSWSSLTELISKPERNLLFDHRGFGEDTALNLAPDCADLPYLLRAYFAWKLGLPFAFRRCSRGRAGAPPKCDEIETNETEVKGASELAAFEAFWKVLRDGVHSASGRTLPEDAASDLYPVPLERRALPPGTVFTDPYGHMIVVGKWVPQGLGGEAMLLGADAQPDATVGRRRFWRGNFLFTPDTTDVGAGFKAFRPVVDPRSQRSAKSVETDGLVALDDGAIRAARDFPSPSLEQYRGTMDDFYTRMDQLIYPRSVAVLDRMRRVVDALEEQVKRRVEAIDVGVAGLRGRSEPVGMPEGYSIFETTGPWEDFATPSRDMRLLIAIDAVRAFPAQVRAHPERFGVRAGSSELEQVDDLLQELLAGRRFTYTRTDGTPFELSLADVVARSAHIEVGYNPNDCIEVRWGAPEGSDERAPCKSVAPAEQRAAMERYRAWFHDRKRPARP